MTIWRSLTLMLSAACAISTSAISGADQPMTVDFRYAPVWWQTAICLPDDWQKTLVGKDGCLLYDYPGRFSDFRTRVRFELGAPSEWVKQELASPRVPIVRTFKQNGPIEVLEEAFALPVSARRAGIPPVERLGSQTVGPNWASPPASCDPAFRNAAIGWAQPVHYRLRVKPGGAYRVVFGLCEGFHKEPGHRRLDIQVEGTTCATVDTVGERGPNQPHLYAFDVKDENGDGFLDVRVAAADGSKDANPILNVLWLYPANVRPDLAALAASIADAKAVCIVRCGEDQPAGPPRNDVLSVTLSTSSADVQEVASRLVVDSEGPVEAAPGSEKVVAGPTTLLCDRPVETVEKTATGVILHFPALTVRSSAPQKLTCRLCRGKGADELAVDLHRPADLRASAERFWQRAKLPYGRIEVPDPGIQAAVDSSIRNIYQAREIKNGLPAFQVGPTCYRGLWVVDGSFLLEAVTFLGRTGEARDGVKYLLGFQRPDGGFSLIDGHWKETGIALWAVTRHARLTGDREWLETVWPKVEAGFDFVHSMREQTRSNPAALNCGLIPDGFSDGGLAGKYPEYTNVYWTLAGMRAAVEAAHWLGSTMEADAWQAEYDDMLATFRRAAERDARVDGHGNRFVPIRMRDDEKSAPQKAQWAFLHALYPGKVFGPDDPLARGNLAMLESAECEGLVYGTGWLSEGIWNYFASFYAHAWLWEGRGDKAAEILYAFANHASPLLTWREEQMPVGKGPAICGDMPHNWASAEMIRLVRDLLAMERGSELHLLEGLPACWLRPGAVVRLREVVTEFGPLTMTLSISKDGRSARLQVKPPSRDAASRVVVHLGAWAAEPGTREVPSGHTSVIDIPLHS